MEYENSLILRGPELEVTAEEFLGDYLYKFIKKAPRDKLFQVILESGEQLTFGQLHELAARICQGLLRRGLTAGDVVTVASGNSNEAHASFLAALWAGGVPHLISDNLKSFELQSILKQVQPRWILSESQALQTILKCAADLEYEPTVIALNSNGRQNCETLQEILVDVDVDAFTPQPGGDPSDLTLILCSSGTTGIPKGVGLSHKNVLSNIMMWKHLAAIDVKQPILLTSCFSWITGVYFFIVACEFECFRVITTSHQPKLMLKAVQDHKLFGAMIPPAVIKLVLDSPEFNKFDKSSLKEIYTGGSIMSKPTVERFLTEWSGTKLYQIYGLTEMAGMVTMPDEDQDVFSVGRVFYNTEIKIVDLDTRRILGPNRTGEIYIRSDGIFRTYVGNEKAARDALENGWLRTGDLGYYSREKYLFITSRIKEIIKFENCQISPVEIESYLTSLNGVADAAVVGVSAGEDSHHLLGLIVKLPGSSITANEIRDKVAENFSESKHLRAGVFFVDSLPRSVAGKLKRNELSCIARLLYKKPHEMRSNDECYTQCKSG